MGIELARSFVTVRADASRFPADIAAARPSIEGAVHGLSGVIRGALSAAMGVGASMGITSALMQAGQFEQTVIAFETMIGSAEETQKTLANLTEFAAKTPFEMPEILQAARGLIQFGERGDELMETLNLLGNAAAGSSQPFGMIALIFNQIRGVGKLLTQDFRQLSTRGVISLKDIAKYYGVTDAAAQDMISHGKVSFSDFRKIIMEMSKEGGRFANLMEKQSTSLLGLWSTLKDSVNLVKRAIGEGLLPIAKSFVAIAIQAADAVRLWVQNNKELAAGITIYTSAFSGFVALKDVLGMFGVTIGGLIKNVLVLARTFALFSPVAAVIGGVLFGVYKLYQYLANSEAVKTAVAATAETFVMAWERVKQIFSVVWSAIVTGLSAIGQWLARVAGVDVANFGTSLQEMTANAITSFANFALEASEWVLAFLQNWRTVWDNLPSVMGVVLSYMRDVLSNYFTVFLPQLVGFGLRKAFDFFLWLGRQVVKWTWELIKAVATAIASIATIIWDSLTGVDVTEAITKSAVNAASAFTKGLKGEAPDFAAVFKPSDETKRRMAEQMNGVLAPVVDAKRRLEAERAGLLPKPVEQAKKGGEQQQQPAAPVKPLIDELRLGLPDLGKKIQDALLKQGTDDKQDKLIEIGQAGNKIQAGILEAVQNPPDKAAVLS